ncbi:MAG: hypothetical protein ACR2OZ_11420 [Verrucomicrobiales bacterium]
MKSLTVRTVAAAALAAATILAPAAQAAITLADLQFWVGPPPETGIAQAVLVIDWRDGTPGLAWGYRWPSSQSKTGRDLLAAIVAADPRLTAQGLENGFVSDLAFDADQNGLAERFRPGFDPTTGEFWDYFVNNEVYFDSVDFTKNGHIVLPATTVVPLGNPYDGTESGRWVESSTGVLARPLVDGSWDGFVYAPFGGTGPAEPVAAAPVPEPLSAALAFSALILTLRRRIAVTLVLVASPVAFAAGPFSPPAGQPASDAVAAIDARIKGWAATASSLIRGPEIKGDPQSDPVTYGTPASALGPADIDNPELQPEPGSPGPYPCVSLGDGGSIVLTFDPAIADGSGADFAVFENGLSDTFLELAFVEVSSDGVQFFRFPAVSCTPVGTQVGSYGSLDTRNLDNLAGKFRAGFGTPFDLAELSENPLLNKSSVTHVRIIDVVGSIDPALGSLDSLGNLINDPYPSYETSGFDLDAVAVLNSSATTYSSWQAQWEWVAPHSQPDADPDSDGIPNLLEYALGADPLKPGAAPETRFTREAGGIRFELPEPRSGASDLVYGGEFSQNLRTWHPMTGSSPDGELFGSEAPVFVRLVVSLRDQ